MHENMANIGELPKPMATYGVASGRDWKVSCKNCGACCMSQRTPPFVFEDGFDRREDLPPELLADWKEWVDSPLLDVLPEEMACIWLDAETRKCKHYEHRPGICREFEAGATECREWREVCQIAIH